MIWLVAGALVPSFLIAWAGGWLIRRVGPRWGLVDRPGQRKIHHTPMPTAGGLAIWAALVLPLLAGYAGLALLAGDFTSSANQSLLAFVAPHVGGLWQQAGKLAALLAGGTVLVILGLVDDRRGLDWRLRLGVQTLVALAMVLLGWRLTAFVDLPLLTGAVSVLWIVGLTNSFNMLDNMDGLSAGVAAIAAGLLAVLMLGTPNPVTHQPQLFVGGFALLLVGALGGFLVHNRPRARLFMGDAGSYLVGYLMAMTTLMATFAGGDRPPHAVLAPLCLLAIPLYDTVSVVLIRLRAGRSPFVGDKSHFSHRLVALGLSPAQAVLTIYLATACCGLGALVLHQVSPAGAAVVLAMVLATLALVAILEVAGRRAAVASKTASSNDTTDHGAT